MGDCGKRAFEAGLRYSGIFESVPSLTTNEDLKEYAECYGLEYIESGEIKKGNYPVLVVYKDAYEETDSEYHAVFCSDIAPLAKKPIFCIITGWDNLEVKA